MSALVTTLTAPKLVYSTKKGKKVSVAHEVLRADPEDVIQFKNGNVMDLREDNLVNLGKMGHA